MRKLFSLIGLAISFFTIQAVATSADSVSYQFDSITVVRAYTFDVECTEEPDSESFLHGHVSAGETISIYVGELQFVLEGEVVNMDESLIIVTNENGEDIIRWLTNGASLRDEGNTYEFSAHKTIDPNYGVKKTLEEEPLTAEIFISNDNVYEFRDNLQTSYEMITDSTSLKEDLNIVVSVYEEGE